MKRIGNPDFRPVIRMVDGSPRTYWVKKNATAKHDLIRFGHSLSVSVPKGNGIDRECIEENIEKGYVEKREWEGLTILNYSRSAQYENEWNAATLVCRGLIIDDEWNVVARPFSKFFNLSQHESPTQFLSRPFEAFEKMDGSLGIVFRHPETGELRVSTRGSMTSDQALWATEWIQKNDVLDFDDGVTPLVEIIYPENRIVVNYGDSRELVFLDAIDKATGYDADLSLVEWNGRSARKFGDVESLEELIEGQGPLVDDGNAEGYVLKFRDGDNTERVKVKLEEYVRLHRIVTGIHSRHIWERLAEGRSMDDIIDKVPDEFYDWVRKTQSDLQDSHREIIEENELLFNQVIADLGDNFEQKDFALKVKDLPNKHLLFSRLAGREAQISEAVWKSLRPSAVSPFADKE